MSNECEALAARLDAMTAEGLVDIKFLLRHVDEATVDVVCTEVTQMLAAYQSGETVRLNFGDSRNA